MIKKIGCIGVMLVGMVSVGYAATTYTSLQQQIMTTTHDWQVAVDAHNVKAIVALYDAHPYFSPTFQNEITTEAGVKQYFTNLAKKPDLAVTFQKEYPRVYGEVGINSGFYTFSYQDQGKTVTVPARFTFIYLQEHGKWMIIEHHSSLQPEITSNTH